MVLYFDYLPEEINTIIFFYLRDESLRSILSIYPKIISNRNFWKSKINADFNELVIKNMSLADPRKLILERLMNENNTNIKIDLYLDLILIYSNIISGGKASMTKNDLYFEVNVNKLDSIKHYFPDFVIDHLYKNGKINVDVVNRDKLGILINTIYNNQADVLISYGKGYFRGKYFRLPNIIRSEDDIINFYIK